MKWGKRLWVKNIFNGIYNRHLKWSFQRGKWEKMRKWLCGNKLWKLTKIGTGRNCQNDMVEWEKLSK